MTKILPSVSVIYEDDFYLDDASIPVAKNGLQDWDCPEAFDFVKMRNVLLEVKKSGKVPFHDSKEHENKVGPDRITAEQFEEIGRQIHHQLDKFHVVLVDGIMLYHDKSPIIDLLDVRLFISAPYQILKQRRQAREGYATIEGFWTDPPGYFDDIVWPGYKATHGYLFEENNVDGSLNDKAISTFDLKSPTKQPTELSQYEILSWSITQLLDRLA